MIRYEIDILAKLVDKFQVDLSQSDIRALDFRAHVHGESSDHLISNEPSWCRPEMALNGAEAQFARHQMK
jgi:hypothetical protein